MPYACAIAPLDQSSTQLGWHQGTFARRPCPLLASCTSRQEGLQFLADPGTPVVAPFDARLSSGGVLTVQFDVPRAIALPPIRVRVSGITVQAPNGPIQKGALLGRVAPGTRPSATFTLEGGSMEALFSELGLDVVGGERRSVPGYALTPAQGGRLLVRASGPANCPAGGLRGLGYALGSNVAPAGYIEPDSGAYGRFGPSRLSNTNVGPPDAGAPSESSSGGGGWGLLAWLGIGGVVLWAAKR